MLPHQYYRVTFLAPPRPQTPDLSSFPSSPLLKAVERQGVSADYIYLACVSAVVLPLLSVVFHSNQLIAQRNLTAVAAATDNVTADNADTYWLDFFLAEPDQSSGAAGLLLQFPLRTLATLFAYILQPFYWALFDGRLMSASVFYSSGAQLK